MEPEQALLSKKCEKCGVSLVNSCTGELCGLCEIESLRSQLSAAAAQIGAMREVLGRIIQTIDVMDVYNPTSAALGHAEIRQECKSILTTASEGWVGVKQKALQEAVKHFDEPYFSERFGDWWDHLKEAALGVSK